MPQGKMKIKARMPPKMQAKTGKKGQAHTTRKAAPMKAKHLSLGKKELLRSEKVLRHKIEHEMRGRAITDGIKTATSNSVKVSSLHSASSSSGSASKSESVKQVLKKFK